MSVWSGIQVGVAHGGHLFDQGTLKSGVEVSPAEWACFYCKAGHGTLSNAILLGHGRCLRYVDKFPMGTHPAS